MKGYKSLKTLNNLMAQKINDSAIDFETKEQMEEKFKEICSKNQGNLSDLGTFSC